MLDYKQEVYSTLSAISQSLPVEYEYLRNEISVPCITYREYENKQDKVSGQKYFLSTIGYTVTLWDTDITSITSNAQLVDTAMRGIGFTRIGSQELIESNYIKKSLQYEAYCDEHTN